MLLHVHSVESILGALVVRIADESGTWLLVVHVYRGDLPELCKQLGQVSLSVRLREVGDIQVGVLFNGVASIVLLGVLHDFDFLAEEFLAIECLDCLGGFLFLLILDVPELSALPSVVDLELAGNDLAESFKLLEHLLLINLLRKVFDEDVGIGVEVLALLPVELDLLITERGIVQLLDAPLGLFLVVEVHVSESEGLLGLWVKHHLSAAQVEVVVSEELVQVQVVCRLG